MSAQQMPLSILPASGARPFLKWVGGKRQIIDDLKRLCPPSFRRYFEPFAGGGALFFALQPRRAVLSDANGELIDTYTAIRDHVEGVIRALKTHVYTSEHYYDVRGLDPAGLSMVQRAARMIYLNKTGFNGLYRVNSRGKFNVPFGRHRNPVICDAANLRKVSAALQSVDIIADSFEQVLKRPRQGDFVYMDPPYIPLSRTANFVAYQKRGFGMEQQEQLAQVFEALDAKGCLLMLSNADVDWMRTRYRRFHLHHVRATRNVNSRAADRGPVGELIVTNY